MRRLTFVFRGEAGPEELSIELDGPGGVFAFRGAAERAEIARLPDGRLSLLFEDGRQISGRVRPGAGGEVEIVAAGVGRRIALAEPLRDRLAHASGAGAAEVENEEIRALMPGRVVEVAVAQGDEIAAGALLLVLEAMKMQNEIRASRAGLVTRLAVEAGRAVEGGALLAVISPAGAPS